MQAQGIFDLKAMYRDTFLCDKLSCRILIAERQREKIRNNYFPWKCWMWTYVCLWCHAGSPPQFLQFPGDQKIRAGEKVELLGNFGGTAPITCTWLKFKKPVRKRTESLYNDRSLVPKSSEIKATIYSDFWLHPK